jgi:glucose-1-phosphate thymidylyltransferase
VYNKPMIYYPLETLLNAGIKDILIIIAPDYAGHFLNLLGSGAEFGARFSYEIQEEPRGLADAFIVGERFIANDNVTMILGDNIFDEDFSGHIQNFQSGAHVFAKKVPDPERYGVVKFDDDMNAIEVQEKPKEFLSEYAVTGIYIFDNRASEFARKQTPSARGELEIPDLYRQYMQLGHLKVSVLDSLWEDAGTFESLLRVNLYMAEKAGVSRETLLSFQK